MARVMKDSGIEWIGKIPKEWEVIRLKKYFSFEKGKNASLYTQEYLGLNQGEYPVYSGQTENEGVMGRINSYDYDINECLFTTTVGAKVMTPKILKGKFNLSQNCLIMKKIQECNLKFFYYILLPLFSYEKSLIPTYMQPSLRMEDLRKYKFFIPSLKEQEKIANYLDKKVADIDLIIEKTKATIEDYKKYKQSLITEVVTKGLDPNVEARETDNIHIKFIPKLWEFKKIKYLFTIKKEIAGKKGFDVLSITQKGIKIKDITTNEGQMAMDYSKYQFLNKGDFAMNHMDLLTGWVDISKYDGVTSPDYRVFILNDELNNSKAYYLYLMQMCYSNKIFYGLGQGVSNLGRWRLQADKFLNFSVPVPPLKEQQQIADYLDKKVSEIDNLISKKESLISEMEEYKKSLIYECVTGKKEVI